MKKKALLRKSPLCPFHPTDYNPNLFNSPTDGRAGTQASGSTSACESIVAGGADIVGLCMLVAWARELTCRPLLSRFGWVFRPGSRE